jgi:hypothetical protein
MVTNQGRWSPVLPWSQRRWAARSAVLGQGLVLPTDFAGRRSHLQMLEGRRGRARCGVISDRGRCFAVASRVRGELHARRRSCSGCQLLRTLYG